MLYRWSLITRFTLSSAIVCVYGTHFFFSTRVDRNQPVINNCRPSLLDVVRRPASAALSSQPPLAARLLVSVLDRFAFASLSSRLSVTGRLVVSFGSRLQVISLRSAVVRAKPTDDVRHEPTGTPSHPRTVQNLERRGVSKRTENLLHVHAASVPGVGSWAEMGVRWRSRSMHQVR